MKFTLSWLKEHLDTDEPVERIAEKLTMIGLEVEHVEDTARLLAPFTIAKVISAAPHPNADRLRVCMVDTGHGAAPVQVVCGAPNARAGLVSVFASPGTVIPGKNITLSVGTIRGVESRGMLVSEAELSLSDNHDGIMELAADAPVGESYAAWAHLGDPAIEINLTPNRPDCAGVRGIARDLAAAGMGKLKSRAISPVAGAFACPVKVDIEDPALCPGFALRLVRGVRNGPSPPWLQRRLTAIGLRPINALVDITNFMTFDSGRPLHVFDAGKVRGNLVVRHARAGESLLALDGRDYTLDPSMCVIADDTGVESLAGIMGGEASGCDETTTDVLIESALWNPLNIAQTGRKLSINSDARYRFERGVDPAFMVPGLDLATAMVTDLCGGTPSQAVVAGEASAGRRTIEFPAAEAARLTGLDVPREEMQSILKSLGFGVEDKGETGDVLDVTVPTWRPDVEGKADLVEEIVRIVGVEEVPETPFDRGVAPRKPVLTPLQLKTRRARRAAAARGMLEAVTWSFVSRHAAELFGGGKEELALVNPIAADQSDMRPSLLPGLIGAAQTNIDRGLSDLALFEVGQVFRGDRPDDQLVAAAGLRHGFAAAAGLSRHWSGSRTADAFDVKADALSVLAAAGAAVASCQIVPGGPPYMHPGRSGTIQIGPQNVLGHFGELHPRTLSALRADGPMMAFEVILDKIPQAKRRPGRARPALALSPFQPVSRDFAFIVEGGVRAGDIVRAAQGVDKKLITDVSVFDVYAGKGIEEGKKSVAIAVTLQPRDKTMTDDEIEAVAARIVAAVSKKTGGSLRG